MVRSICLSVVCIIATSGCAAVIAGGAAGAGAVSYIKGEYKTELNSPVEKSYEASLRALKALKFQPIETTHDAIQGRIIARDSQNRRIEINLNADVEQRTRMTIRVGVFGDEIASKLIDEKIQEELRAEALVVTPAEELPQT